MNLLHRYAPQYQFSETHHVAVQAPAATVLDAVAAYRPNNDRLIGLFMALRELPARTAGAMGFRTRLKARPRFGFDDFLPLGREGDREIAFGLIGRFWEPGYGLIRVADAQAFAAHREPGVAKLVIHFGVEPDAAGLRLTTVTRVHCADAATRARFTPYWLLIRPVSGWIRRRMLASIKAAAQSWG